MPHPFGPPTPSDMMMHSIEDERAKLGLGTEDQGIGTGTVQDFIDTIRGLESFRIGDQIFGGEEAADIILGDFYSFAISGNLPTDPADPQASNAYFAEQERLGQEAEAKAASGGRVEFASERNLRNQQSQSLQFGRGRDKLDLLVSALLEAVPFMVNPGQEFFPGQEPGGAGQELARLLGVGFEPQRIPTAPLPLSLIEDELAALQ